MLRLASNRRERAVLQRPIETSGPRGNLIRSWSVEGYPWVIRQALRGRELIEAQQVTPEAIQRITLRQRPIDTSWRLLLFGKKWVIEDAINASVQTFAVEAPEDVFVQYASKLPFRIKFGGPAPGEIMIVNSISGSNWTVTRGADGTTSASHGAGAVAHEMRALNFEAVLDGGNSGAIEILSKEGY